MNAPSTASNGLALAIAGLAKSFHTKAVLEGIDLAIRPSEFVAVVGKSGCGKSTLLRLIAGLDQASSGSISLDGKAVAGVDPRLRVVFQDHRLLPWKRVLDNVAFGLGRDWAKEARAMLEQVGLAEHADDLPGSLSGGEKQRVSLARALLTRPGLLLLDEPLGALDALTRIGMQSLIERLWQEQRFTALLITHDVDEAIVLADRIVVLKSGIVDLEIEVGLPRPRPRTGAAFDRIKELVLARILRSEDAAVIPFPPTNREETAWHAQPKTDSTSGRSSPRVPEPEPSAPGATLPPSSTVSSMRTTTSRSRVPWSGASST